MRAGFPRGAARPILPVRFPLAAAAQLYRRGVLRKPHPYTSGPTSSHVMARQETPSWPRAAPQRPRSSPGKPPNGRSRFPRSSRTASPAALAGPAPSARDRQEFRRMGAEKAAAFAESWNAMALQVFEANQTLALSFLRAFDAGPPQGIRRVRRPSGWPCGHGHRPSRPGAGASVRRGEREAPEPHETPVSGLTPRPGGRETGRGNADPRRPRIQRRAAALARSPSVAGRRALDATRRRPPRLYFHGRFPGERAGGYDS